MRGGFSVSCKQLATSPKSATIRAVIFARSIVALGLIACTAGCVYGSLDPLAGPTALPRATFVLPSLPTATATPRPTATPATPTLRLSAESFDTVVQLTWPSVPGASGYFVFRDAGSVALTVTPITTTTYLDTGLTNGRSYRYSVTVVDAVGQSMLRSSEVLATPKAK